MPAVEETALLSSSLSEVKWVYVLKWKLPLLNLVNFLSSWSGYQDHTVLADLYLKRCLRSKAASAQVQFPLFLLTKILITTLKRSTRSFQHWIAAAANLPLGIFLIFLNVKLIFFKSLSNGHWQMLEKQVAVQHLGSPPPGVKDAPLRADDQPPSAARIKLHLKKIKIKKSGFPLFLHQLHHRV